MILYILFKMIDLLNYKVTFNQFKSRVFILFYCVKLWNCLLCWLLVGNMFCELVYREKVHLALLIIDCIFRCSISQLSRWYIILKVDLYILLWILFEQFLIKIDILSLFFWKCTEYIFGIYWLKLFALSKSLKHV
jgi:hypothetical protein